MYIIEASHELRELAIKVPIPIEDMRPVPERQIWMTSSSPSPEETALLDHYYAELFPGISRAAESDGLSGLSRGSPAHIICIEKGGMMWPGKNQVGVSIVLEPPSLKVLVSETPKEVDSTGPNLNDGDIATETPSPQATSEDANVGASEPCKAHEQPRSNNKPSEDIAPLESRLPQKLRDRQHTILQALGQPRRVVTWRMTEQRRSSVQPRTLSVGDTLVLNEREFIEILAGGIPLLTMRCHGERVEH
ncbi:hypothetical protein LTR41_010653 [Exophiala xenobiotica]|nr:hypothetical protein LTR41_010653 [Exophiala xenobiotica]